jgi:hypothetical protein
MLLIASSIKSNVDVQRENITLFDIALKPFIMLFLPQEEGISLQGKDRRLLLEANVRLEILRSNLTGKTLKRNLADQVFGSLLVMTNLTQSNGSRTVFVRLHYASSGRSSLASCLVGGCKLVLTTRRSLLSPVDYYVLANDKK